MIHRLPKTIPFLWTFVCLILPATLWSAPPRADWFPLQDGNQWTLTTTNGDVRTIQIAATLPGPWQATGLFDMSVALRAVTRHLNLQARVADHRSWQTVARFGRQSARPWHFNITGTICDDTRASWTANDATLVTPAGTFPGCRRWHSVRLEACPTLGLVADSNPVDIWFARGTGPVGLLTGSGNWYWLTAAKVGDRVYPAPTNGLNAQLTADHSVYTNVSDHFYVCPPCTTNNPPCEMPCYRSGGTTATAAFTFTVTNDSTQPQTFVFGGQAFDIQLIDTNGVVVALWSTGKAFPQSVDTLVLPPGQSLTYPAPMELVDSTGARLHGPYTARAYLTNLSGPAGIEATTTLQVIYELVPAAVSIAPPLR